MNQNTYLFRAKKRFDGPAYQIIPTFYQALMRSPDVLSWKIICVLGKPGYLPEVTTAWHFGEKMVTNDSEADEIRFLNSEGIETFFCRPVLALKNSSDLIVTRLLLTKSLILVYEIEKDRVLLDQTKIIL